MDLEHRQGQATDSIRREITAALEAWGAAFAGERIEVLLGLYAQEAVLWGTLSPELRETPEAVRAYFEPVFAFGDRRVAFAPPRVRVYGAAAVAAGAYTFSWRREGRPETVAARYSLVWHRRDGRWLIVDHHSSAMPSEP